jgi:hypothetical protein
LSWRLKAVTMKTDIMSCVLVITSWPVSWRVAITGSGGQHSSSRIMDLNSANASAIVCVRRVVY